MMFLMYLELIIGTSVFMIPTIVGSLLGMDYLIDECGLAPFMATIILFSVLAVICTFFVFWLINLGNRINKLKAYKKIYKKDWRKAYKQDLLNLEQVKVNAEIQELAKHCNINPEMLQGYNSKQLKELKRLLNIH